MTDQKLPSRGTQETLRRRHPKDQCLSAETGRICTVCIGRRNRHSRTKHIWIPFAPLERSTRWRLVHYRQRKLAHHLSLRKRKRLRYRFGGLPLKENAYAQEDPAASRRPGAGYVPGAAEAQRNSRSRSPGGNQAGPEQPSERKSRHLPGDGYPALE